MIKYVFVLAMLCCSVSVWSQADSCERLYDFQISNMNATIKTATNTKQKEQLQKSLESIVREKEKCMRSLENAQAPKSVDTTKPVPLSEPAKSAQPQPPVDVIKTDTVASAPVTTPAKTAKEKIAAKNVVRDNADRVIAPAPTPVAPARGINYSGRIDTLDRNVNSFKVRIEGKDFYYIVVDLDKSDIQLHLHHKKEPGHNFSTIESLLSSGEVNIPKVEMITNGGMYMHDGQPQGLYIENGKQIAPIDSADPKNGDNFHLMPNGVFYIRKGEAHILTTDSFRKTEHGDSSITFATQSGPMLVIDGKRHPIFTEGSRNEKLRSGVCVIDRKTVVFAICDQVNFWDFANFFKDYIKGRNALFLDGSVSRMYLKKGLKGNIRKDMDGTFGPMISVTAK